ncbi:MAG: hypothetical protein KIH69_019035, partial [Anaerolineae bacterium]|nr:hypothetical protein [Anaerolineae bacterium]
MSNLTEHHFWRRASIVAALFGAALGLQYELTGMSLPLFALAPAADDTSARVEPSAAEIHPNLDAQLAQLEAKVAALSDMQQKIAAEPNADVCFTNVNGVIFQSADALALRQGIATAAPGSVLKVAGYCAGVSSQSNELQVARLNKNITVQGGYLPTDWSTSKSANQTVIDAQNNGRGVVIEQAGGTLSDLTITNGYASGNLLGGGVIASGPAKLLRVTVLNSKSDASGGGVALFSNGEIFSTSIAGNNAANGGGAILMGNTVISNSLFGSNKANTGNGGGALLIGISKVTKSDFIGNQSTLGNGGGAFFQAATDLFAGAMVGNIANNLGGGAVFVDRASLQNVLLSGNMAGSNGGGAVFSSTANLTDTQFISNASAMTSQGANLTGSGGGAYFGGQTTILRGEFTNNVANGISGGGAATFDLNSSLITTFTTFTNNRAFVAGGIWVNGAAALTANRMISNAAAVGGGVLIANNENTVNQSQPLRQIANVLFADNKGALGGAAIAASYANNMVVINNTIGASSTLTGSAISIAGGSPRFANNIIANYQIGFDANPTINNGASVLNHLFSNVSKPFSGTITSGASLSGTAAFVNPAGLDYHLSANSNAIDKGMPISGLVDDFEGDARPQGAGFDLSLIQI